MADQQMLDEGINLAVRLARQFYVFVYGNVPGKSDMLRVQRRRCRVTLETIELRARNARPHAA